MECKIYDVRIYLVVSGLQRRREGEGGEQSLTTQMMFKQAEAVQQERELCQYVALISATVTIWHSDEQMSACLLPKSKA